MKTMIVSLLAFSSVAFAAATVCDVRDYGASGNGKTKDTQAIQKAIDACAQKGAGVVYFPPGSYLIGTITLKSNLTLHLEAGATLLASPERRGLPSARRPKPTSPRSTGSALIYGEGLENVTITGLGTIDGQGLLWYKRTRMSTQPVVMIFIITTSPIAQARGTTTSRESRPRKRPTRWQTRAPGSILLVHCTTSSWKGLRSGTRPAGRYDRSSASKSCSAASPSTTRWSLPPRTPWTSNPAATSTSTTAPWAPATTWSRSSRARMSLGGGSASRARTSR